jgi:5'-3' exonuclease
MGIHTIWYILSQYLQKINIKKYEYQTCGIDGHYALHHLKHVLGKNILETVPDLTPMFKSLIYSIHKLKKDYKINSIVVMEGNIPPIQEPLKQKRDEEKAINTKKSIELLKEDNIKEAIKYKKHGLSINPYYCKQFYEMCSENNIECIISPYSADHQLRYLEKINKINFIIGCDGDLIALNCKNILYDFNYKTFEGFRYNQNECQNIFLEKNFSEEKLLIQCLFRGCKYYTGIESEQFEIVLKLLNEEKEIDHIKIYQKLFFEDESSKKINKTKFEKSYIAYKYGIVYCPIEHKAKYLNELPIDKNNFIYKYNLDEIVGKIYSPEIIEGVVNGKINALTYEEMKEIPQPTHDLIDMFNKMKIENKDIKYKRFDNYEKNTFISNKYDDKMKYDNSRFKKFNNNKNDKYSKPFFYNSKQIYNNDIKKENENLFQKPFFFNSKSDNKNKKEDD